MKISVVINTRNSGRTIKKCLDSIFSQTYKSFETILVDANSKDETLTIAASYPVKVIPQDRGNLARARNIGLLHSTGDIVAFLDSDAVAPFDWLQKISRRFNEQEVAVVGGPDEPPAASSMWERAVGIVDVKIAPLLFEWGSAELITGCNVAYRKASVEKVGGFDEELDTAEETELDKRISDTGARLVFDTGIKVFHHKRSDPSKYFKQHLWYGIGKGQMLRRNPDSLKVSSLAALLVLALPCALAWMILAGWALAALAIILLLVGGILVVASYVSIKSHDAKLIPIVGVSAILWIYSEGFGLLLGLLGKSRTR
jgi:glycosyltransferase involved in cell wall biosynthesis